MGNKNGIIIIITFLFLFVFLTGTSWAELINENTTKSSAHFFSDVPSNNPDAAYVSYLVEKGIIKGFPDGTFCPNESLTRAQAAAVMTLAGQLTIEPSGTSPFNDVGEDYWAKGSIAAAVKAGYIKGFPDKTFHPDETITRAQAITLLLRLSKQQQTANLPQLRDVTDQYWAAPAIATGLASGMVGLSADGQNYFPDAPFSRIDMAHALGILLTHDPDLSASSLPGKLKVIQGKITVIKAGSQTGEQLELETTVNQGDTIITGKGASAELNYPDGSSILIKENSQIKIEAAQGRKYVQTNGQEGIAVDWLNMDMQQGSMFAAIATKHEGLKSTDNNENSSTNPASRIINKKPITLASLDGHEFIASADSERENQETPWYQFNEKKKVKLKVDMPCGVAGIRGTFVLISVYPDGHATVSCLTGDAEVSNAANTVTLGQNQSTTISAAGTAPGAATTMTATEVQQFNQVQNWIVRTAIQMDVNHEIKSAPPIIEMIVEIPDSPLSETTPAEQVKTTLDVVLNALQSSGITITEEVKQELTQLLQTYPQEESETVNKVLDLTSNQPVSSQGSRSSSSSGSSGLVSSIDALNSKVTLTFSKTITEAHIDETNEWVPVVTFADGSSYKISILDDEDNYSMCLHSVHYTAGTSTLQIITPGAKPGIQYNMTIYKGTAYTEVETTGSFTFPDDTLPPEFITGYPRVENIRYNKVNLVIQTNEIGIAYYVALLVDELSQHPEYEPKTAVEVKNWDSDSYNQISSWSGSISMYGDPAVGTVKQLRSDAGYKVYIVTEDDFDNLMTSVTTLNFQAPSPDADISDSFTDDNFKQAVWECLGNTTGSIMFTKQDLSDCMAEQNETLNISNKNISSLAGIENFEGTGIKYLYGSSNQLTSLPNLPSSLTELNCSNNELIILPELPSSLKYLYCSGNQLTSLPNLPSSLTDLYCSDNQLTSLPDLPTNLIDLACYGNQLTSLPNLPGSLIRLQCFGNPLGNLPVLPSSLTELNCSMNKLTDLPNLPDDLISLNCDYNGLIILPELPGSLTYLYCSSNQLTSLPDLPSDLTEFDCSYNFLNVFAGSIYTQINECPATIKNVTPQKRYAYVGPDIVLDVSDTTQLTGNDIVLQQKSYETDWAISGYGDISDFTFSSSDESVATVDDSGLITAIASGTCTIYAKFGNIDSDYTVVEIAVTVN